MGRKLVMRNKARGRAFQSKLAEMVAGHNVGTLGGEDVMTEEFSYEAKTWDTTAKSHPGDWRGEKYMQHVEKYSLAFINIVQISIEETSDNLILMRWKSWLDYFNSDPDKSITTHWIKFYTGKFIGLTWMRQAEANCPDGKLPIVVVHQMGARHQQDLVMIRESYWASLSEAKRRHYEIPK